MNADELLDVVHRYFPMGINNDAPAYEQTIEFFRLREARATARQNYGQWRSLCRAVSAAFPEAEFPGVHVQDLSLALLAPDDVPDPRCFSAQLWLPVRNASEQDHQLVIRVSYIAPSYAITSACNVRRRATVTERFDHEYLGDVMTTRPKEKPTTRVVDRVEHMESFEFSADELPFATKLQEAITNAFPQHLPLPPSVAAVVVPDVATPSRGLGEATLFGCLLSDDCDALPRAEVPR